MSHPGYDAVISGIFDILGPSAVGKAMMAGTYNTPEWSEEVRKQLRELLEAPSPTVAEDLNTAFEEATKKIEAVAEAPVIANLGGGSVLLAPGGSINYGTRVQAKFDNSEVPKELNSLDTSRDLLPRPGDEFIRRQSYVGRPGGSNFGQKMAHVHTNPEVPEKYIREGEEEEINFRGYKAGEYIIDSASAVARYEREVGGVGDSELVDVLEDVLQAQEDLVGYDRNSPERSRSFDRTQGFAVVRTSKPKPQP